MVICAALTHSSITLQDLGIDSLRLASCLQLFFIDQGYDISDYYAIDPLFWTMGNIVLEELIAESVSALPHHHDLWSTRYRKMLQSSRVVPKKALADPDVSPAWLLLF